MKKRGMGCTTLFAPGVALVSGGTKTPAGPGLLDATSSLYGRQPTGSGIDKGVSDSIV